MAAIEHTARRSGPIDRDQLRALRVLRAAFGDVQVLDVEDNPPHDTEPASARQWHA